MIKEGGGMGLGKVVYMVQLGVVELRKNKKRVGTFDDAWMR